MFSEFLIDFKLAVDLVLVFKLSVVSNSFEHMIMLWLGDFLRLLFDSFEFYGISNALLELFLISGSF